MNFTLVFIASPCTYNGIGVCSAPIGFNVLENFMHKIKSDISVSVMSYKLLFYFIQEQFIYQEKNHLDSTMYQGDYEVPNYIR